MYFLIYGEDSHESHKKLDDAREKFSVQHDSSGMNTTHISKKGSTLDNVAEAIFATPFLAEKKLVVLDGFLQSPAADQKKILEYLGNKPDSTTVIFYETSGAKGVKKSGLHDELRKSKDTQECTVLSGLELTRRVQKVCGEHGVGITTRATQQLVSTVGDDRWRLENELEKLCAFASTLPNKEINEDVVRDMVAAAQEEEVFAFLDACVEGKTKRAIELLEGLFVAGMSEIQVTALLTKQLRTLIAVKDLVERGERDKYIIAKEVGVHHFPASKAMATSKRFSPAVLAVFHGKLLEIDRGMKTSSGNKQVLLDIFTARLTSM